MAVGLFFFLLDFTLSFFRSFGPFLLPKCPTWNSYRPPMSTFRDRLYGLVEVMSSHFPFSLVTLFPSSITCFPPFFLVQVVGGPPHFFPPTASRQQFAFLLPEVRNKEIVLSSSPQGDYSPPLHMSFEFGCPGPLLYLTFSPPLCSIENFLFLLMVAQSGTCHICFEQINTAKNNTSLWKLHDSRTDSITVPDPPHPPASSAPLLSLFPVFEVLFFFSLKVLLWVLDPKLV